MGPCTLPASAFVILGQVRAKRRARPEDPCLTIDETRGGAGRGAFRPASRDRDRSGMDPMVFATASGLLRHRMTKRGWRPAKRKGWRLDDDRMRVRPVVERRRPY